MGKKKGQTHATNSFLQLVGKANTDALKPFVAQLVAEHVSHLQSRHATAVANLSNRLRAMEDVIASKMTGFGPSDQPPISFKEAVNNRLFDIEDEVTGYQRVDRPAQEGDLLRLQMRIKPKGREYGTMREREFSNLGRPPFAMNLPILEMSLIGTPTDQIKVVPFDENLQKATGVEEFEFKINRISEKIPQPQPEQPKKEEPQNEENQNASEPSGSPEAGEGEPA